MTDPTRLSGLRPLAPADTAATQRATGKTSGAGEGPSFADVLKNSIREVNALQKDADQAIQDLTTGKTENVTQVLTAVEKADIAFRALMQVRNKLVDAYDELNRLRV